MHDMAGRLAGQLHDPLAQIGIDHLDAVPFEKRIEMALLGQHRLAFDEPPHAVPLKNLQHDLIVLGGVGGPMHLRPEPGGVGLELLEVVGQIAPSCWL